ncbi:ankyrin repeat-containing domain protein [Aspergillus multicolor]|uniref:ankyrin repeat domain-containing protein n=1 Tax=Aspergillus multicolor TaxID=41759 RepID=UPI003CCDA43C
MGATGLHLACQYGHLAVALELLSGGSDIDAKDNYEETPLIRACASGESELVEILLAQRANAKVQGRHFGTALQAAALHGNLTIAQCLIRHGVDVEAEGGQFGTALQAASVRGHVQVVQEFLIGGVNVNAPGGDYNTIHNAAPNAASASTIKTAVESIIQKIHQPNAQDISYQTKIESEILLVLDRTLDMNLRKAGLGQALHAASRAGHDAVVQLLLNEEGVDVNSESG